MTTDRVPSHRRDMCRPHSRLSSACEDALIRFFIRTEWGNVATVADRRDNGTGQQIHHLDNNLLQSSSCSRNRMERRVTPLNPTVTSEPTSNGAENGDADSFSALTPRERSILNLISKGYTNIQIGTDLHISRHTVAQHIAKMLRRTGASNRTDLVNRAYRFGILPREALR